MIFRWGHFADLHLLHGDRTYSRIRQDLNDKLKVLCRTSPLNAIFIAGDIFNQGSVVHNSPKEGLDYDAIKHAVTRIHSMAESCGCKQENIIVVPGNHDLPRTKIRKDALSTIIKNYQSAAMPTSPIFNPDRSERQVIYDSACEPFAAFCEQLYEGTERTISLPHGYYALKHNGIHWANVVTLNTATFDAFSKQDFVERFDGNRPGFLIADDEFSQLEDHCATEDFSHTIDFVLAHHSLDFFAPREAAALMRFMETVGIDLYLCGHIHRQGFYTFNSIYDIRQISCGGVFNDSEGYNKPCFYIGEYDNMTQQVTIRAYAYSETTPTRWIEATDFPSPWTNGIFARQLLRLPALSLRERIKRVFLSDPSPDIASYMFPKKVRDFLRSDANDNRFVTDMLDILSVDIDSNNHSFRNTDTKSLDFVVYYCLALYYKQHDEISDGKFCLKTLVEEYSGCFDEYLLFWETKAWLARRKPNLKEAYQYDLKMIKMLEGMGYDVKAAIMYNAGVFVSYASTIAAALEDTASNACPWLTDKNRALEIALKSMPYIAESWKKTYGTTAGYPKHYSIWIMLLVHKCLRAPSAEEKSAILEEINTKIKESHGSKNPYSLD